MIKGRVIRVTGKQVYEAMKNSQTVSVNGIEVCLCKGVLAPEVGTSALCYCKSIKIYVLFYCPTKSIKETLDWAFSSIQSKTREQGRDKGGACCEN